MGEGRGKWLELAILDRAECTSGGAENPGTGARRGGAQRVETGTLEGGGGTVADEVPDVLAPAWAEGMIGDGGSGVRERNVFIRVATLRKAARVDGSDTTGGSS